MARVEEDSTPIDWQRMLFVPLLAAGLMSALAMPVFVIAEGLPLGWNGEYLQIAIPLVVFEALWSRGVYRRARVAGYELWLRIIPEQILLVFATLLFSYLWRGPATLITDVQRWLLVPAAFLDIYLYITFVVVGVVWYLTHFLKTALDGVGDPLELTEDRSYFSDMLQNFVISGGIWLVVMSGVILGADDFYAQFQGRLSGRLQLAVISFFALSLMLLGYRHYLRRMLEWRSEQLDVPRTMARRWVQWGATIVAAVALLAFLLPAGYQLGPQGIIFWVLRAVYIMFAVFAFLFYVGFSLVWLLLSWLWGEEPTVPGTPAFSEFAPEPPPQPTGPPEWWLTARAVLLLISGAAILAVVVAVYLRDRTLPLAVFRRILHALARLGQRIWAWWLTVWRRGQHAVATLARWRPHRTVSEDVRESGLLNFIRARSNRARLRRYYLLLVQRAAAAGHTRRPAQTPLEFAATLAPWVAEDEHALYTLTHAFITARYNRLPVDSAALPPARNAWSRLRAALRNMQRDAQNS